MNVDVMFHPNGPLNEFLQYCETEFQAGPADCVWIPDHLLGNTMHPELAGEMMGQDGINIDYCHDPFVSVMALDRRLPAGTDFGIGVTDLIRRGPVDIARTAATVSQALGRPLLLGVGAGEMENLIPADYPFPEKPVGHFEKQLEVLRGLLDTGIYESESSYRVDFGYNELPAKIFVGGQGPRMLRLTAQYGDGWFPAWKMSPDEYGEKVEVIEAKAAEFGRPCPETCMFFPLTLGPSQAELFEEVRRQPILALWALLAHGEAWLRYGVTHPSGSDSKGMHNVILRDKPAGELRQLAEEIPAELTGQVYFLGSAEELFEQIKAYRRAGMQRAVLTNCFMVPPRSEQEFEWQQQEYTRLVSALRELD